MNAKLIKRILFAGLALVGLLAGHTAFAQSQSATVNVSAAVPKACRFYTSGTPTLTVQHAATPGFIDPAETALSATGSVNLTYRCQNTVLPLFDIDASGTYTDPKTRTVALTGPATINADITVTGGGAGTGLGAGGGNDKTAVVAADIPPANYATAVPGTYTKTVTIGITAQ